LQHKCRCIQSRAIAGLAPPMVLANLNQALSCQGLRRLPPHDRTLHRQSSFVSQVRTTEFDTCARVIPSDAIESLSS